MQMLRIKREHKTAALLAAALLAGTCGAANAAIRIEGQATAGGKPFANSTVTLWVASSGDPRQLAEARAGSDGMFQLGSPKTIGADAILYLTTRGDGNNAGVTWLSVLGNTPPAKAVINELTTVASVWTNAQFRE
jgi:hypothetical protein